MHLAEDFRISSRLIRKTFRDEQKMNPKSAWNIWKLLARTRPEPDPKNPTRFQLCRGPHKTPLWATCSSRVWDLWFRLNI